MIMNNEIICDDCGKSTPYHDEFNALSLIRSKIDFNYGGKIIRSSTVCDSCVRKYEGKPPSDMYEDLLFCLGIITASIHLRNISEEESKTIDEIRKRIQNFEEVKRYEVFPYEVERKAKGKD